MTKAKSSYPSKEEILDNLPPIKKETLKIVKNWKIRNWKIAKEQSEEQRFFALMTLIKTIANSYNKPVIVNYRPNIDSCCYQVFKKTIFLNKTLSILSSLHELGHHLYGASEFKACAWSVAIFKQTFSKAYDKLEWKEHMLVKK